jgi:hypothetical protein
LYTFGAWYLLHLILIAIIEDHAFLRCPRADARIPCSGILLQNLTTRKCYASFSKLDMRSPSMFPPLTITPTR